MGGGGAGVAAADGGPLGAVRYANDRCGPSHPAKITAASAAGKTLREAMACASVAAANGEVLAERWEIAGVSLRRALPPGLTSAP